jgi:hypothetical protein
LNDLRSRAIDYWALGHIHERSVLFPANPLVLYPGNLQARRFDECGPKGATLGRVTTHGYVEIEELALDEVRFAQIVVDVTGRHSLEEVMGECATVTNRSIAQTRPRLLVARIRLQGQTVAHHDLLKAEAQQQLVCTLRDRLPDDGLWLDQVSLRTFPVVDRAEVVRSGGFEAALVQLTDTLTVCEAGAVDLGESVRTPLLNSARFDDFLPALDATYASDSVQQAEARLLGLLEVEAQP